jgi:hypothetical protein
MTREQLIRLRVAVDKGSTNAPCPCAAIKAAVEIIDRLRDCKQLEDFTKLQADLPPDGRRPVRPDECFPDGLGV